jgi:putative ABC transport system permease protein
MTTTAVARKSLTDLTRRKARAVLTVLTLALAVASVGIFAVPALMQQSMDREVVANKLADVTLETKPLVLNPAQVGRLERVPNIRGVAVKNLFSTRIYVGSHRQKALFIGVPSFAGQQVDAIATASGRAPPAGGLSSDTQNASTDKFRGPAVRVIAADGHVRSLPVSGQGRSLMGGAMVAGGYATFYATAATIDALSGSPGYASYALRLNDTSRPAVDRTVAAVSQELRSVRGFTGFSAIPGIRKAGDYPGKEGFNQIASLLTVVTILALLSALVLLSNTMSTLISEQTGEIASMKAIGATRRQIARIYRRTALILGALGAIFGALLGVVLANVLTRYFANLFYGLNAGWHVDPAILIASILVGLLGPPLAALPAIRRAARLPVHEGLQSTGSATGGQGRLDVLLRHVSFLPRSAQIGLRGVARRKRRTVATALQVALAVGTLLGLLALGTSVANVTRSFWDDAHYDIAAGTVATRPFTTEATRVLASTAGVKQIQPLLTSTARMGGKDVALWGTTDTPLMSMRMGQGRWFTASEGSQPNRVAVIGRQLAENLGGARGRHKAG